jgi:hypothetical protein
MHPKQREAAVILDLGASEQSTYNNYRHVNQKSLELPTCKVTHMRYEQSRRPHTVDNQTSTKC